MAKVFPAIGQWFLDTSSDQLFEVVAVDEKYHTIEIQYQDGDISEIDLETWGVGSYLPAETPEDGNGGYGFSAEEHWADDHFGANDYNNPLELLEPDIFQGFDDV